MSKKSGFFQKVCSKKKALNQKLSQEEFFKFVQDRAFKLWDEAGRPQGRDWEFWFKAEEEVRERLKKLSKI